MLLSTQVFFDLLSLDNIVPAVVAAVDVDRCCQCTCSGCCSGSNESCCSSAEVGTSQHAALCGQRREEGEFVFFCLHICLMMSQTDPGQC